MMLESLKDEITFIINTKLNVSERSTRSILAEYSFLNAMLLNRLSSYKLNELKAEKLILLLNKIDFQLTGNSPGFNVSFDMERKVLSFTYLGEMQS